MSDVKELEETIQTYKKRLSREREKALSWKKAAEGLARMVEDLTEKLRIKEE